MKGRIHHKKRILDLLARESSDELFRQISLYTPKDVLNHLFTALCHNSEIVRWNAVQCFGQVVPAIADEDIEAARVVMRRFLWMLNDESGGIGWGVPESMAEIFCHHNRLRLEYLHMLISYMRADGPELFQDGNYLELPLLQRGLLWGVHRLCRLYPNEMNEQGVGKDLVGYLDSSDEQVAGMALLALSFLTGSSKVMPDQNHLTRFFHLKSTLRLFTDEGFVEIPLAEIAEQFSGARIDYEKH